MSDKKAAPVAQDPQTKVLTVVDKSTKALTAAAVAVEKVMGELNGTVVLATELASDIEFKQSELNQIEKGIEIAEREAAAELNLRIKENRGVVLSTLMREAGYATITMDELSAIRDDVLEAQADNAEAIEKAVKAAESKLHASYTAQMATLKAEHKVAVAEKDASITAKTQQIGFLEVSIADLKATIAAERQARIDIAASEAQKQGVTVNNGK